MISREEVIAAYRNVLGREPENDDVIAYHQQHPSVAALRLEMLNSDEFAIFYQSLDANPVDDLYGDTFAPHQSVETAAEGPARAAMWARIAESWRKLGEEAPHWSVLTLEQFRPDAIEENREAFLETRSVDLALVDAALDRVPDADTVRTGLCLEVGCGVGRATRGLADRFGQVLAVDVSAPHLDIAARDLAEAGCTNVAFRHMKRIEDYADLGAPQFFYSRIVLQHNPPPVQAAILRTIFEGLAPGGIALFQIITHIVGYTFSAEEYLAGSHDGMEMHVLPQQALFSILRETGMEAIEINRDDSAVCDPRYRSHMVLARKV